MGQRVQIYMAEYNAANTDTEHPHMNHPEQYRITAYHNQWGYGWRGVLDAVGLILLTRLQRAEDAPFLLSDGKSHLDSSDTEWLYQKKTPEEIKDLCKPFAESVNKWKDMVDFEDNNNGIIVIRKDVRDFGGINSIETMFLRGGCTVSKTRTFPSKRSNSLTLYFSLYIFTYSLDFSRAS